MPMKVLWIRVPQSIYEELRRLKKEKKIRSISEFVRNLLIYYLEYLPLGGYQGRVVVRETVREISFEMVRRPDKKEMLVGYGEAHNEIMSQLKKALAIRAKKLKKSRKPSS